MPKTTEVQREIVIDGVHYTIEEKKEVKDKKFQWFLYLSREGRKYMCTQTGSHVFSTVHTIKS